MDFYYSLLTEQDDDSHSNEQCQITGDTWIKHL